MPAVRTDKMIVKEEKDKDKDKQKTTRQSFSCAECRRYVSPLNPCQALMAMVVWLPY